MYLVTKISSYLKSRKAEKRQFKYDLWRVITSLRYRPRNWMYHYPFELKNEAENMSVWVSNKRYGLNFSIEGREWGGVTFWSAIPFHGNNISWRRRLFKEAMKTTQSPWVRKYGYSWNKGI